MSFVELVEISWSHKEFIFNNLIEKCEIGADVIV